MTENFTCPICGEKFENIVWDPQALAWIRMPEEDPCMIIGSQLVCFQPAPTPYMENPAVVVHSH